MSAERRGLFRSMALSLAISTVTTLVIGSMVYYTLKRHDLAHLQDAERMADQAAEQQAVVASQVIAAVGRSVLHSDLSRLQDIVNTVQSTNGLRDVMIVNKDNMVLAATHAGQVGQTLQDATWLLWKGQNREVAQRAAQNGQPVFAVVEPLKDKGETLAWAILVFTVPERAIALRAPMERVWETAGLMAPILVFLLMSIGFAMKLAAASIRKQVQRVMASVLTEPLQAETDQEWLPKAS